MGYHKNYDDGCTLIIWVVIVVGLAAFVTCAGAFMFWAVVGW